MRFKVDSTCKREYLSLLSSICSPRTFPFFIQFLFPIYPPFLWQCFHCRLQGYNFPFPLQTASACRGCCWVFGHCALGHLLLYTEFHFCIKLHSRWLTQVTLPAVLWSVSDERDSRGCPVQQDTKIASFVPFCAATIFPNLSAKLFLKSKIDILTLNKIHVSGKSLRFSHNPNLSKFVCLSCCLFRNSVLDLKCLFQPNQLETGFNKPVFSWYINQSFLWALPFWVWLLSLWKGRKPLSSSLQFLSRVSAESTHNCVTWLCCVPYGLETAGKGWQNKTPISSQLSH